MSQVDELPAKGASAFRRSIATAEGARIARGNSTERRLLKSNLLTGCSKELRQRRVSYQCVKKLGRSPFRVDLAAENERIDEKNKVGQRKKLLRQKFAQKRLDEAKRDIILRALEEGNELDSLRREKRKIIEEEKRLKAMIEIERTNENRKRDLLMARRAEKDRALARVEHRRSSNIAMIRKHEEAERDLLIMKHDLKPLPEDTFSSYLGF